MLVAWRSDHLLSAWGVVSDEFRGGAAFRVQRDIGDNVVCTAKLTVAIRYSYDADDLLTTAGAMTLTRDGVNGLLSGTTLGVVAEGMTYNSLGEVATAQASVGGNAVLTETYTRDSLGRISQKAETVQGVTTTYGYTYDVAGRLTEVSHNGVVVRGYGYDSNGNRLSTTSSAGDTTYTYDAQDRLLTRSSVAGPSSVSYTYTANGELLSQSVAGLPSPVGYAYDALGNLRTATLPDGTQLSYVIDGENRRIGKQVNGSLVQGFLYESQLEPVAELDGGGNVVSRFVYCGCGAGNIPQQMLKGGVTYRILADHLGSPRLVVDSTTGVVAQRMDYDEFGNVTLDTNPGFQPFGFAGGIYDRDTGLTRHGARDYDPETGRWTAKDPIRFTGRDFNFYGYAANDPINAIDLTGNAYTFAGIAAGLIAGGIVGGSLGFVIGAVRGYLVQQSIECVIYYGAQGAWHGAWIGTTLGASAGYAVAKVAASKGLLLTGSYFTTQTTGAVVFHASVRGGAKAIPGGFPALAGLVGQVLGGITGVYPLPVECQ